MHSSSGEGSGGDHRMVKGLEVDNTVGDDRGGVSQEGEDEGVHAVDSAVLERGKP